jgi:alpha-tubulin suppressor-like RCC1 family protein
VKDSRTTALLAAVALASFLASPAGANLPPSPIKQFWGGGRTTLALLADGSVWAWGRNTNGQLGNNQAAASSSDNSQDSHVPLRVHGPGNVGYLNSVIAISAGESHNLALRSDGTVWAWGWNGVNQLGNGVPGDAHTPVQVSGLTNVVAISGRGYHCLALKSDGTVWAWGWNQWGQLGNGTTNATLVPVQVSGLPNLPANHPVAISAGYTVSLALMSNGTVLVWGTGLSGELGQGQFGDHSYTPIQVMGLSNVVAAAAGFEEPNALKSDGTLWMWGSNNLGQLGNGSDGPGSDQSLPGLVHNLTNVILGGPTGDHDNCAITSDHTVWTWGRNYNGQLGIGTADQDFHPLPVQVPAFGNGGYVVSVQTPDWHSLALRSDGTLWSWGSNDHGQLGNATTNDSYSPTPVLWPSNFYTLTPCRILDTRNPAGIYGGPALAPAPAVRTLTLAAQCGVPASATAVVANLTVTQATAAGSLSILPGDGPAGNTTVLAFNAGQTRANNAILNLSVDGQETIALRNTSSGTLHFILDVSGYLAP